MEIYVNGAAKESGDGTKERPFQTISEAANVVKPGDEVRVFPGIYREHVNPHVAGTKENPISFISVEPLKAVITGAEEVKNWEPYKGNVWVSRQKNAAFGSYNPYTTLVYGDWLDGYVKAHTGEVYINGKSLYETDSLQKVLEPEINEESWDRDFTVYTWFTCQDEATDETVIYANFQGKNPNEENVEINVRQECFYPLAEHVDYITLDGFTVTKAATQWAPPTALQDGMIGPHWAKGWVIENCEISNSKCSGISLGKYYQEGNDNKWTKTKVKDGAQTQRDCSFIAQLDGWSKETVGSHIVRNCDIHDCGQTGIVGNLGCVFSVIENNHIHHINNKRDVAGAELGGIKFHAAIDVIIRENHIHHCVRGIWLDWQVQGTRVSHNLFHDNCFPHDYLLKEENNRGLGMGEDIFIEIAHGPTLVDNNIFLSERSIKIPTQGLAFVNNLIGGAVVAVGRGVKNGTVEYDSARFTPIHKPHSTGITGVMTVLHGDVRFCNNVFATQKARQGLIDMCANGDNEWDDCNLLGGTFMFDAYPTKEEWMRMFEGYCGEGAKSTRDRYYSPLPVFMKGNAYFNGARAYMHEEDAFVDDTHAVSLKVKEDAKGVYVKSDYASFLPKGVFERLDSDTLGEAFEPEERFEGPNGETIVFSTDFEKAGPKQSKWMR